MDSLITNLDLFVLLKSESTSFDHEVLFGAVVSRIGDDFSEENRVTLKEFCRRFTRAVSQRWKKSNRFIDNFRRQYGSWLDANIDWPSCVQSLMNQEPTVVNEIPRAQPVFPEPSTSSSVGTMTKRTRKPFEDLGNKQKKRRSDDHIGEDSSELAYAAAARLKEDGREDIASVIEYLLKNPEAAAKINQTLKKPMQTAIFTPEKALGLLLSLKLSKWQYITLRETAIREGAKNIYPSYYKVQQTKLDCYPPKQFVSVTDSSASIVLQALLDITVKRILQSLSEDVQNKGQLKLISKWGFDGASNQSRYKQKMENDQDDSSIFMTSLVPLKLTDGDNTLWINPKPCSALYCRPVQFSFVKENEAVVIDHKRRMDDEIKALVPTECNHNNKVTHQLMMTMIDAKVCIYLSEAKSNASCYLCLAKPTEMNRLDAVTSKTVSSNIYEFGLSSLHARINCMECLLHIAYRLDFKQWAARTNDQKEMLQARKKNIQNKFKNELNLLIDIVKQGSGTTNDGNTARRFFEFPIKTAAITGLDEDLIKRFAVILQAVTSGEKIDVIKFKDYARKTAERYVELYDWYYMSSTVHKLLIHGADIIEKNDIVPIGTLSEEASESRNKDFRRFREHHSQKKSRLDSNQDILNMLLVSSDPLLSAQRPTFDANKKQNFYSETLDLIQFEETGFEFLDVSNLDSDSELETDNETHPMISASLPGEALPQLGQLGLSLYPPQPPAGMAPEFLAPPPRPYARYAPRRPRDPMPAPPAPAPPPFGSVPGAYASFLSHPTPYTSYLYRARAPPQPPPTSINYPLRPRPTSGFVPPAPAPHSPPVSVPAPLPPPREASPMSPERGAPAPYFCRGALIRLEDGSLRRVEEMRIEDFVTSAERNGDLALTQCTLLRIDERGDKLALTLTYDRNRSQVELESTVEHPYFVYGRGWASCKPERTLARYGLRVQRLQVGDVCVSLVPRKHAPPPAPATHHAPAPPQTHPENLSVKEDARKRRWSASDVCPDDHPPHKKR